MLTAGVFVDVTNQFYATVQQHNGARIDFEKYLTTAVKGYSIYRAFAYGAQMNAEANSFINCMRNIGYETRYRQAVIVGDKPDIRRTDRNMPLAMDIWRTIEKLDVVVIGSNDPDLAPLVQRIKELGRRVIIYACNISNDLRQAADQCIEIERAILEDRKAREPVTVPE